MFFKKANSVQKVEADLQALERRRPKLQSQLSAAEAALDASRNERREFLIGDDAENGTDRATLERKLLGAERDVAAYSDALAALDAKIIDTRKRLGEARDEEIREAESTAREAAAIAIGEKAVRLERAIDELAAAADELRDLIDPGCIEVRSYENFKGDSDKPMDPFSLVRLTVAEGLFSRSPELFTIEVPDIGGFADASMKVPYRRPNGALCVELPKHLDGVNFLPASGAVERNIVIPLRRAAQEFLDGKRSPYVVVTAGARKTIEPPPFEFVDVVFTKPVRWTAENGQRNGKVDDACSVPKPVANAAIERGTAFPMDTDEARAHLEKRKRWHVAAGHNSEHYSESVDLGVDLEKLIAAERARLNGWPAPVDGGVDEMREASE
jgi:hypothetical protein